LPAVYKVDVKGVLGKKTYMIIVQNKALKDSIMAKERAVEEYRAALERAKQDVTAEEAVSFDAVDGTEEAKDAN